MKIPQCNVDILRACRIMYSINPTDFNAQSFYTAIKNIFRYDPNPLIMGLLLGAFQYVNVYSSKNLDGWFSREVDNMFWHLASCDLKSVKEFRDKSGNTVLERIRHYPEMTQEMASLQLLLH